MTNMKNNRICIISTVSSTLSAFVIPVAQQLQKTGFEVTMLASMSKDFIEQYSQEFKLINVNMKRGVTLFGMIKAIWEFYKIFKHERFDMVQYATPNAAFYASIASTLAGCRKRVYCQWGIRYVGLDGVQREIFKTLERVICMLSTHIRPASRLNLQFAVAEGLYQSDKAKVIGDGGTIGVNFQEFDISMKESYRKSIFNKYPQLKSKTVFGFIGRLDKDKGVNELFEAFIMLNHIRQDIALIIIGSLDKPEGIDPKLFAKTQSMENVIFTGYIKDVPQYISCLDILVHPSYREGFSMVIQQSMAMGIAVITTNIPGPSEVIEDGISGMIVQAKSSSELLLSMKNLMDDPDRITSFSTAGYERARKIFNRDRMIQLTIVDREDILNN